MQESVSTLIDALGLLLVALGGGFVLYGLIMVWADGPADWSPVARGAGLTVAGGLLIGGSWLSDRIAGRGEPSKRTPERTR